MNKNHWLFVLSAFALSTVASVVLLGFASFFLAGCATNIGANSDFGPPPKSDKGTVAYNPGGFQFLVDERRRDALLNIEQQCGSKNYKIVKKRLRVERLAVIFVIALIRPLRTNFTISIFNAWTKRPTLLKSPTPQKK